MRGKEKMNTGTIGLSFTVRISHIERQHDASGVVDIRIRPGHSTSIGCCTVMHAVEGLLGDPYSENPELGSSLGEPTTSAQCRGGHKYRPLMSILRPNKGRRSA